jgi:hypothetical protein
MRYQRIVTNGLLAILFCIVGIFARPLNGQDKVEGNEKYPLEIVVPFYSDFVRNGYVEGKVHCEVDINEDGRISQVINITGHELLQDLVKAALKQWLYRPGVPSRCELNFIFQLYTPDDPIIYGPAKVILPNEIRIYALRLPFRVSP